MLTAIRELAEEAERGGSLAEVVARGDDCVARTQAMLPVLTEAGVVDAGAAGLVEIVRGLAAALTGEPLPERPAEEAWRLDEDAVHQELSRYRYCTVFLVEGEGLDAGALEAELEPLGDSLFVVGDASALKVHVHTDDPGRALSLGVARGTVEGVEIANMHAQTREREERLLHAVPAAGRAHDRRDRRRGRHGQPAAVREPRRARRRRRPHDEPVDRRAARGGRGRSGARGGHPPERPQRPHGRRARGRERLEAGARRADGVAAGRARGDGRLRRRRWPRTRTRRRCRRRPADVATGAVTVASRDVETNGLAVSKGAWLGLADGLPVAGGASFEEVTRAVLDAPARRAAQRADAAHGRGAARARRACSPSWSAAIPSSSSRCTRAASRTTRSDLGRVARRAALSPVPRPRRSRGRRPRLAEPAAAAPICPTCPQGGARRPCIHASERTCDVSVHSSVPTSSTGMACARRAGELRRQCARAPDPGRGRGVSSGSCRGP